MASPGSTYRPRGPLAMLLLLAALPIIAKGAVMAIGAEGYFWQSLYKIFQLGAPVCWRRRYDGKRGIASIWPVDEQLPSTTTWAVAAGSALLLAGGAVAMVLLAAPRIGLDPNTIRGQLDQQFSMTPTRALVVVVYLFSANAALEELHFRAWLDRELSSRFGNWVGIGASALTFGAMHLFIFAGIPGSNWTAMTLVVLGLFVAGAIWSGIARLAGGIHAAWLAHGLTDAGLLTWGLFYLGYLES